jgi:hypothetical protein
VGCVGCVGCTCCYFGHLRFIIILFLKLILGPGNNMDLGMFFDRNHIYPGVLLTGTFWHEPFGPGPIFPGTFLVGTFLGGTFRRGRNPKGLWSLFRRNFFCRNVSVGIFWQEPIEIPRPWPWHLNRESLK